jgi:hypothetical protein
MTRTVSTRISNNLHEQLRDTCNKTGNSISEYLAASLELAMTGHAEFDFGNDDEENDEELQESCKASDSSHIPTVTLH